MSRQREDGKRNTKKLIYNYDLQPENLTLTDDNFQDQVNFGLTYY